MRKLTWVFAALVVPSLAMGLAGCNGGANSTTENANVETAPPPDTVEAGHDHPSHGPHDGDLIELGNEDFHGELVHKEGGALTIYILGSDAKTAVPIDATELVVNVSHEGTPEQFKLTASPDEGDPEGKSSRFVAADAELDEHLHEEGARAKLVVVIDGKQFTGEIAHEHDHAHDHSHD